MFRGMRKALNVLTDPQHFWREVIRNGFLSKNRSPKDWLLFRHSVTHACAIRRKPLGALRQVSAENLFMKLRMTPVNVCLIPRNAYNPTWLEIITLAGIVHCKQPRIVFEFGTFDGKTTLHLALNTPPEAIIYTIDIVAGEFDLDSSKGLMDRVTIGEAFLNSPHKDKIVQITGDTRKIDYNQWRCQVDFVFVDADHSYDGVMFDSRAAFEMIRPGGIVVWHDYLMISDVTRALIEIGKTRDLVHLSETSLVFWQAPE